MDLLKVPGGSGADRISQMISVTVLGAAAAALALWTCLSAIGLVPWFDLSAFDSSGDVVAVGRWLQIGGTVLLMLIFALVPASWRVMQLENSHRNFKLSMDDVTRAYWAAHAADRAGDFRLMREFDAVRERMEFLRRHPDLEEIEPQLLELAAQMSTESRDLAKIYADDKVARAREMISLRSHEAGEMQARIERAHVITQEMKRELGRVEMDEAMARSALARLREELDEILPKLEEEKRAGPGAKRPRLRVAVSDGGE